MNFAIQRCLEEMEQSFTRERKKYEMHLEEIDFQSKQFKKGLDDLADRLRYVTSRYDLERIPPVGKGYSIIVQAHEEGHFFIKQYADEIRRKNRENNFRLS